MYLTGKFRYRLSILFILFTFLMIGCSGGEAQNEAQRTTAASEASGNAEEVEEANEDEEHEEHDSEDVVLALPELTAVELNGERLKVVASTSIIGDVVSHIGGEMIELTTLIGPGQDSHSYEPSPQDIRAATDADVIFVNGWDLEESLAHDLEEMGEEGVAVVPISAGIEPLVVGEAEHEEHDYEHTEAEDDHQHSGADPHV
jgi:ABC-type Zn uptake system ZnuABC Zn-binding protein ZnuA